MPHLHPKTPVFLSWEALGLISVGRNEVVPVEANTTWQQDSWSYWLSDITLKRFQCEMLNTLYTNGIDSWTPDRIPYMLRIASKFETDLETL